MATRINGHAIIYYWKVDFDRRLREYIRLLVDALVHAGTISADMAARIDLEATSVSIDRDDTAAWVNLCDKRWQPVWVYKASAEDIAAESPKVENFLDS